LGRQKFSEGKSYFLKYYLWCAYGETIKQLGK